MKSVILFFLLISNVGYSQIPFHGGGELTYTIVDSINNIYKVRGISYIDCRANTGINIPLPLAIISKNCIAFNGDSNLFTYLFKVNGQYGYPFPMTCPGSIPTCSLSVSPNFGYYQSIYENFIALPKSCNEYEFQSYCYPMVNNALSNIIRPSNPVGSYSVMTAYLNQSNSWINSSSNIRNHNPCPLVCINSRTNYSFNALDIDGDSLVYNLINLQDYSGYIFSMGKQFVLPNRNLIYRSPTSAQHPTYDCGFNFNSKTGEYKFKPDTVQESGVSIKIDEYRNGQLVGYTQRVCEFFVLNHNGCGEVSLDTASTTTCTVVKNTMEITDSFGCYLDKYKLTEMVFCENSALDIRLKVINKDKKVVKLNTFTSPGIVVDLDTNKLDSIRNFKIQWTNAKAGKHTAVLELNSCPDTGLYNNRYSNHVLFPFQVLRTPRPSKDTLYYCAKGGAKEIFIKNLDSGVTVSWSHHNGIVQSNLDTTKVKIALTHDTTYYIYYKYFGNANPCATCNKVDTLFVKYVPDFNHTLTPQNATVCINAGANINIQGDSLKKPFNFIWSSYQRVFHPTTNLLLDSASAYLIANPIIKPFLDSKYYVTITDKNGCSVKDSVQIKVIDSIPNFSISASKTAWCGCDTAQLSIQANQIAFCQNSDFPINTATSVANTSSSNFSWPKFPDTSYPSIFGAYGGKYVKHRFFIPNSELKAMNVAGKNLKQFSFYTDTITQIKYKKVRIEISCSEFSKLDAKLYPTTVFYKDSMIILSQMEFIVPLSGFGYNLGKEENLFIDFSFENDTTTKTNSQFIVDSTSYYSASCIYSNFPIGSLDSSKNYFFYRPKFSFYVRSPKTVSPSSLIWSPSAGLSNTTSFNPIVNRCAPITYTCTASSGVCNAMDTITIFADTNNLVSYDTFVCSDIPVRLNTSIIGNPKPGNSFTYLWRSNPYNPSLLDTTILNPIIIPYQTAYYFLKVSGGACDKYDTVKITRGSPLNLSMNKKDPTCSGANGRAVVKTNNGIGPFTYTWNPSNINDDTIKNITSGKYKVTVQAADGCLSNDSITLNNIIQTPSLTLTKQNVRCFNEANGSVKVKVNSAETGPFQYTWIPANANKDSIFNLAAGWYSVTVLDTPSNCTARDSILITQPSKLSIDADSVDVLCFGNNTGSLNTKTTGGTPTYTYTWSDISIGNNASANNKTAGNYTVTVIDSKGCRDSNATRINQPIKLTGSLVNKEDVKCYGDSNGIALIDVIGGTKPYQYNWGNSTNETDSAVNTLKKGNHQVIITDKNNCIDTVKNISIAQPDSIYIQINAYPAKCFGQNNGSAKAIATGGNGGYSYSWSEGSNTDSINSKTAGIYSLTVTDIKGCNEQASTIIYQSDSLMSKNNQADSARCKGEQNGRAIVHILGGKRPYTFAWNTSPIQTDSIAINLSANDYSVTSTDANGCKKIDTIAIAEPIKLQIDSIKIDPIDCESINGGRIEIKASGGNTGVQYSIGPFFQNSAIFTNIDRGVYTATARDYKGCQDTKVFTILQGKPIQINLKIIDAACIGIDNGRAWIESITGGLSPFTVTWSNGQNTDTIQNLQGKQWIKIQIIDAMNCQRTDSIYIGIQSNIIIQSMSKNVTCYGGGDGEIEVRASGGKSPYSYLWFNNTTDSVIKNLSANQQYTLTVTDALGCRDTMSFSLKQPQPFNFDSIYYQAVSCPDAKDGLIEVTVRGGSVSNAKPYQFSMDSVQWQTNRIFRKLSGGVYTLYAMDGNGCKTKTTAKLEEPPRITLTVLPKDTIIKIGYPVQLESRINSKDTIKQYVFKYQWIPTEGLDCSDCASPVSKPNQSTTYKLKLDYNDGCKYEGKAFIDIKDGIFIPTAFSPNQRDAMENETFKVYGENIQNTHIQIYNRWNEKVFEESSAKANWNGYYRSDLAAQGVYSYHITITFIGGKVVEKHGEVMLFR